MRKAEASHNWSKLREAAPFPSRLSSVTFSGIAGLFDTTVDFESPITMVCGLNGVGKTIFLRLLWAALDWDNAKDASAWARLQAGKVALSLFANNTPIKRTFESGNLIEAGVIPENVKSVFIDVPREAFELQDFFQKIVSIRDTLNGVDPIVLEEKELALVRYITGKSYEKVEIYEIEQFDPMVPFFVVQEFGVQYDIKTMSLGEISTLNTFWRLRRATAGSFLFIDEPETFISPTAQAAMMDVIAHTALTKRLSIVISSHSTRMMDRLQEPEYVPMYKSAEGSRIFDRRNWRQFLLQIGFLSGRKNLLLVEDSVASKFLSYLLNAYDLPLANESEVLRCGGEGVVTELRRKFPWPTKATRLIGVYDGDMQTAQIGDALWPFSILPGGAAPEAVLKKLVAELPELAAQHLSRHVDDIRRSHSDNAHVDLHDWPSAFGEAIGIDKDMVVAMLLNAWISLEANQILASAFVLDLRTKLTSIVQP